MAGFIDFDLISAAGFARPLDFLMDYYQSISIKYFLRPKLVLLDLPLH
jgi:hypothetical protein